MPQFRDHLGPCSTFFAADRNLAGVAALCMQATIVLWPVAAGWATRFKEMQAVKIMLDELSVKYEPPPGFFLGAHRNFTAAH